MNWTEPKPPTKDVSYYNHTTLETPLGKFIIEWKSWKKYDSYSISIIGDKYIGEGNDLEDAKARVINYMMELCQNIENFLYTEAGTEM
jgi:hypothetical protein